MPVRVMRARQRDSGSMAITPSRRPGESIAQSHPRRSDRTRGAGDWRKLLSRVKHEIVEMNAVGRVLPEGAVHQGVALQCEKLPKLDLEDVLSEPFERRRVVVVLDQISDPHNEGAIMRSAAAFGASAVVVQDRHAPPDPACWRKRHRVRSTPFPMSRS